ncbi:hypothetical protein FRC04_002772 [Tulasnella sp. 424]|nr:hypothetical protein FRC04_002772 [Tulasnella sp. 424]KAG8964075.1 hypothetical protein FRC05_004302 [Tulasnella sp. 425]
MASNLISRRSPAGHAQLATVGMVERRAPLAQLVKPAHPTTKVAKSARLERTHLPVARARLVPRYLQQCVTSEPRAAVNAAPGWYSDSTGSTSCAQCPAGMLYSAVGSDDSSDCKSFQGSGPDMLPDRPLSCSMVADNDCPNPTGNGPQGTAISRKRHNVQCTKGFEACPLYSGRVGFDCVDTENDPESCGGCLGLDGEGPGTDCTAIKGVSVTRCVKRSCVIDSCRKGWVKSFDGTSCVSNSHSTGSSESDDLHVQDIDAKKRRSSAKRAIRGNRDIF